jgi:hypothetical protein
VATRKTGKTGKKPSRVKEVLRETESGLKKCGAYKTQKLYAIQNKKTKEIGFVSIFLDTVEFRMTTIYGNTRRWEIVELEVDLT